MTAPALLTPDPWLAVLLDVALKGTLVLLTAALFALGARRASAATRHLAWALALYGLLALPVLSLALPGWQVPVLPRLTADGSSGATGPVPVPDPAPGTPSEAGRFPGPGFRSESRPAPQPGTDRPIVATALEQPVRSETVAPLPADEAHPWSAWVLAAWAGGACLVLTPMLVGLAGLWCLARKAQRIRDQSWAALAESLACRLGLNRRVTLLRCVRGTMPMTCGVVRPVVLLPVEADDWPAERRRLVLLHELAHVRRRDCLSQLLAQVACALYWFHPLAWVAARQLRLERERACDDQVLLVGSRASDYASLLLETARLLRSARVPALAAVAMAQRSQLEGRLLAVLDPHRSRRSPSPAAVGFAFAALAAVLLPLAALRPWAAADDKPASSGASKPEPAAKDQVTVTGRVLDPDGKPVAGARVGVLTFPKNMAQLRSEVDFHFDVLGQARTDAEGRFRLKVPRTPPLQMGNLPAHSGQVMAVAKGYALGLGSLDLDADKGTVEIWLKPEKVCKVRFVDLQGAPAKGVRLQLIAVMEMRKSRPVGVARPTAKLPWWPITWTTDGEGRVAIHGFAADQHLHLVAEDDRFTPERLDLGAAVKDPSKETVITLPPAQFVVGRVTYKDTGKPVAGARVSIANGLHTRTDKDGRYRLNSFVERYGEPFMNILPPEGEPYVGITQGLEKARAGARRTVDAALPRGLLVTGQVTEVESGKPVAEAIVYYVQQQGPVAQPSRQGLAVGDPFSESSGADGRFRIVVPPGKGHLVVDGPHPDYVLEMKGRNVLNIGKPGGGQWYAHAFVPLDLKADSQPKEVTVRLHRGVTVTGKVVGPDGKPAPGVQMITRLNQSARMRIKYEVRGQPVPEGGFEFKGCDLEKAYPVVFLDEKNHAGAWAEVGGPKADGKPLTVRLAKCGSAVARFVDAQGKPREGYRPHVEMVLTPGPHEYSARAWRDGQLAADAAVLANIYRQNYQWDKIRTDARGVFHMPDLVPGVTYRIWWNAAMDIGVRDFSVKPGEALDLKDIVIKGPQ
jgi:beta-lactamase regulating signal transducer with metallopeptidase domain/protocatechuate 3,4-dioxygenase beta subunit